MKKPTKKAQVVYKEYNFFDLNSSYTSATFRAIADEMDRLSINYLYFEADGGYNNVDFRCVGCRKERIEEVNQRYTQELNKYEIYRKEQAKKKENRKAELIKEAKKLGLKVEE